MRVFLKVDDTNYWLANSYSPEGGHLGPINMQILVTRTGQVQDAIDLEFVTIVDRKNQSTIVSFQGVREYEDLKEAEADLIIRPQTFPHQGTLYLGARKGPQEGVITYYAIDNAYMDSIHGVQQGVSVTWHYRFRGGQIYPV